MGKMFEEIDNLIGENNGEFFIKDRLDTLIEELPKNHGKIRPSAVKAGYSNSYASAQQKRIKKAISNRIKKRVSLLSPLEDRERLLKSIDSPFWDINELVGEYLWITKQTKDIGTKERAIRPILQQFNILPKEETGPQVTIPTLNIVVKEKQKPHTIEES